MDRDWGGLSALAQGGVSRCRLKTSLIIPRPLGSVAPAQLTKRLAWNQCSGTSVSQHLLKQPRPRLAQGGGKLSGHCGGAPGSSHACPLLPWVPRTKEKTSRVGVQHPRAYLENEALAAGGTQRRLHGEVAKARVVGPTGRHFGQKAADTLRRCSRDVGTPRHHKGLCQLHRVDMLSQQPAGTQPPNRAHSLENTLIQDKDKIFLEVGLIVQSVGTWTHTL